MILAAPWIAWSVVIPLAGALLVTLLGRRGRLVAAVAAAATVVAGIAVAAQVLVHGPFRHAVGGWGAPLGIELRADRAGALMLSTFGLVGGLVVAFTWSHMPAGPRQKAFLSLWLFAWGALDALLLSADVFNMYVALELVTLAAVALVSLDRERRSLAAALRYLLLALVGSLAYLTGTALLYASYATLDIELLGAVTAPGPATATALALMTVGLSLKTALFPLHAWLPPLYASAPTPVSALLSGVLGKASFVVLLRLWFEVFPAAIDSGGALLLGILGAASAIWGSLLALRQKHLAMLVAYSSVSQVGYLLLAFPIASGPARSGAVYLAISHAAASAAMFTATGTVERAVGTDRLSALAGVAHRRPLTFFTFGLAGASVIGLPPSGGFVAKWLLLRSSFETGQWWWALVVLLGGLISAGYMFRILRTAFLPLPSGLVVERVSRRSELAAFGLAVVALSLGIVAAWPLALLAEGGRS